MLMNAIFTMYTIEGGREKERRKREGEREERPVMKWSQDDLHSYELNI